ncbi:unnamed protein product [Adineta steineri]|uniref:G-protein coupled receptors family 1 profile domain-containing protein n=2 Tax=Adineta steineri TaxID=433720 RepID=A0A818QAF1_9BILA|nr:unnamed protein product [Adineta steineri]CAF3631714.1 unnamed protein product [Adineta steineri]
MTNSAATLSSILATLTERLTYIALPFYVILGILGNTFCIIYFLNKSQRASSCAFYLLLTAITNLFAVTFGVSTSILSLAKPVVSASLVYCKLRMYINHTSIFIGRMFTILATIDTYTMTSQKHTCRMFSQRSNAIKCAIGVVLCCPLIAVHIPIMNTIVAGQCVMTGVYALIFSIYQMLIAGIIPPLAMIIFSCLAYLNMKKIHIRPDDTVKRQQQRQHIRMVTTQITIYIISAELVPITTMYKQLTSNIVGKSQDRKAIEAFIIFIASNFLLYLNTWAPFFIYYATSSSFRTAFIRIFHKTYRIHPMELTYLNNNAVTINRGP